jgi:galactose oxidase-like protein/Big-like domain-containing protein/glyoxal oxidase-like protein/Kelch motif protein
LRTALPLAVVGNVAASALGAAAFALVLGASPPAAAQICIPPLCSPDNTPPAVAITSPAQGATVSGTITITANASDNRGVAGVQFKANGGNIGGEDTAAPYAVNADTTTVPDGSYTLTAVARDAAGNQTASAPVTITVANQSAGDISPPTVAITSPQPGATVSGTIAITANASDDVSVAGVQFKANGTNIGGEDNAAPYAVNANTTTVPDGSYTLTAVARDAAGNLTTSAPVTITVSNSVGQWSGRVGLPIVAIHMHLLPDGSLLAWGNPDTPPADGGAAARVWNPMQPQPVFQQVPNPVVDVYCSGHSFLADGRLLVTGGHFGAFVGSDATTAFDFRTRSWSVGPRMNGARWYPTNTTLANGDVVVVSGSVDSETNLNRLPEVWNSASGWRPLSGAQLSQPLYPWMHLAPNGRIFNSGPQQTTRYLDTSGTGSWTTVAPTNFGDRQQYAGTSVMYEPGKVLILGGSINPPTATAEVIDLNAPAPTWQFTNPMARARRYPNATLLPDGRVLVTGGTAGSGIDDAFQSVLPAEMWDPATGTWRTLASMSVRRMYHSTAVLLPDARVFVAGGGANGDANLYDGEYYSPPYLFRGARPAIGSAPESAGYGQTFLVGTSNAADIAKVTLVALSSSTHEFNQNQRFVPLDFSPTGDGTGLSVTVPSNPNVAPPGYYMLFILNGAGVPSVAHMVRIGS